MRVEQVMFRSGAVRRPGDLYLPDSADDIAPTTRVIMGHSVILVKEALRPHAEYLVRAGFAVLAIDWRTVVSTADAAPGLLNSSRQIGASLGLAALGTVARNGTGQGALGLTLSAALLIAAVLIALTVMRRTSPPSRAEQADDRDLLPGSDRQSRKTSTVPHPVPEVRLTERSTV